jgi:hypothetical protein
MSEDEFEDRDDSDDRDDPVLDDSDWNPDPATVCCPECAAEVSEEADRCPDCGHYFSPGDVRASRPGWYRIAIAILIGLLIWAFIAWH